MPSTSYAIALGSNRRHGRFGAPEQVLVAALAALGDLGEVDQPSRIARTPALGPAGRSFANAAVLLHSKLAPVELLAQLKLIEREFGRRPGRRWGPRVLDLDIILWSGGSYASPALVIPHPGFRDRGFVLGPLCRIAPAWRDPVTNLSVRHLAARLTARRPAPR